MTASRIPSPPKLIIDPFKVIESRTKSLDSSKFSYKLAGTGGYGLDAFFGDSLEVDESAMSVRFCYADGNVRDGVGDELLVEGIDHLSRFKLNPICGLDHFKDVKLPIGLAEDKLGNYGIEIDIPNRRAYCRCYFWQGKGLTAVDPSKEYAHAVLCSQIFAAMASTPPLIRAGSIGYQIRKAEHLQPDYARGLQGGLKLLLITQLESSVVVTPASPLTVAKSFSNQDLYNAWEEGVRRTLSLKKLCGKELSPYLCKSLSAAIPQQTKTVTGYEKKGNDRDKLRKLQDRLLNTATVRNFIQTQGENIPLWEGGPSASQLRTMIHPKWETYMEGLYNEHKSMSSLSESSGGALVSPAEQRKKIKALRGKYGKKGLEKCPDCGYNWVPKLSELKATNQNQGLYKCPHCGNQFPVNVQSAKENEGKKNLPLRENLRTEVPAQPYRNPTKNNAERMYQRELGERAEGNDLPQNFIPTESSNVIAAPTQQFSGWAKIKQLRAKYSKAQPSDSVSPEKARQILKDGEVRGHKLTPAQEGLFGAAAGRDKKSIIGYCKGMPVWLLSK